MDLQKKQIIDISSNLKLKEQKLVEIQSLLDVVSNTNKNLEKTNQILIREKNDFNKNYYEMQNELNMIKNLMHEKENKTYGENEDELDTEKISEELQQLRELVRKRNEECDEINIKYNLLKDEKNILNDKLKDMKLEFEKNVGVMPYSYNQKYELEKLQKEYKNILNKKKYYKEQCKLCNEIIEVIKKKLNKQQIKEIENDKSFQKLINIKSGNNLENDINYISYKNNKSNSNINDKEFSKINNNNLNSDNENNNINVYNNNNNIILDNKFNSNINNIIDNKNDKGKNNNNNDDDISEHISISESLPK